MEIKSQRKRLTLNDIAQLSGVSKTTASMILNGQAEQFRISPETCQKVESIAKQYGYRANAYAKALKLRRTNVIGLVIPDLTNYGFASTAKTLERLCRENGLQLVIACSDDNPQQEKQAIERLLDRQIDLLITAPTHQDPKYYKSILKHTLVLQLDRYVPNLELGYVISADTDKIAELVALTIKRYQLKEYFYFGGQSSLSPSQSRLNGFIQGLRNGNLLENPDWILHKDYQSESGYQMMTELVERLGRLPEAIFTASYTILEGVLRYLTQHKQMDKLLNRELHLATFDDHDLLNALPFHIHSIRQDHEQIALQTFSLIRRKLQGKSAENIQVECQIQWRD
ncbi:MULTISPECIES: LacI family DNA-binding transcriptional regulator [Glaesserella]|uniref:Transcriptional regulator n=1 Tax=Glaesserella australis TaxID=2094024 RepID=A0A328BZ70_9PAST|nr:MULTISPECIES: LacI family DNA-binding transcriptional regulator [Glaesserella]AUI67127.1 transcriptional regulator [Glaesserella sp. 15-184]RAL18130.1 transcriptional regulator [Glaesserella australis]